MKKAIAAVAVVAMLACTLGLTACSGGGSAGSSEEEDVIEEDVVGDGVSGVVETDWVYYTDLIDEDGSVESLAVTLDTVIVPVKAIGEALDDYSVELLIYGDETAEWSYVEAEVDGEDGFTLSKLLSEGTVYYDPCLSEEWDDEMEYEEPEVVDVDVELSADDECTLMIYWGTNGSSFGVVLSEDDLGYSTVEVDVTW